MEIFITIMSGVFVFVVGQIMLKIFIEPIQELKKVQRQLIEDFTFYANIYYNAGISTPEFRQKVDEVSDILRKNATKLISIVAIIPFYSFFEFLHLVPETNNISKIKGNLIGISNLIKGNTQEINFQKIHEWATEIENLLKLK